MPAKNSLKQYVENGYYHIYNRGVEKREIFLDKEDYSVFLSYLKQYLSFKDEGALLNNISAASSSRERNKFVKELGINNFYDEISLLCHGLMPNHFHFLVKQNRSNSIDNFMSSLGTRYTMYFNKKYKRVGHLYQGVYKAILIPDERYLLYLSKYIHHQTAVINQPSSLSDYLGQTNTSWVNTDLILSYFKKGKGNNSYADFVNYSDPSTTTFVKDLVLEN